MPSPEVLQTLINKQDNFEVIRDQIAAILVTETANQMTLAAGEPDPTLWNLNVYTERANAWEQFLKKDPDPTPIINVWYDNSNFDESGSNVQSQQKTVGVFNVDCYGYGLSEDVAAGGHRAGDKEAALNVQRAIRLVRNMLMAGPNTYLQIRGLVWQRWPQAITIFQPQIGDHPVEQVVGARIALRVIFNEFAPQYVANTLEFVNMGVKRTEDGLIVMEADFDYS